MSVIENEQLAQAPPSGSRPQAPAISIEHLSKSFRIPRERYHTLKQRALHPVRARQGTILQAVQDVTVDIARGEFFGIVGRNGSGKSTLLKCLAGIYTVDEGTLSIDGRLSPFIELGVGFNMELSARDNVMINAIMLGLTRRQARDRFGDIIAFAELDEFTELKLKNYSSGMLVRLAFATAIQVDADLLLIDEVLAVGDAAFQQKCFDEFGRLKGLGRTILFVTHDMGAVERFCDRAMLLERGRVVDIGEPSAIARQYNQHNFRRARLEGGSPDHMIPPENPPVRVLNAVFESADGETAVSAPQGVPLTVRMELGFVERVQSPIFAIHLLNESGQPVFSTSTDTQHVETGTFEAGTHAVVRLRFENWLAPGRYRLNASAARAGFGADLFDAHLSNSIVVIADNPGGGAIDLPHSYEIERP